MVHVNKNLFEYFFLYQNPGSQVVATHILAFMVVGINNSIKESVGHFATTSAKAEFLFQKMWKAVALLKARGMKVRVHDHNCRY